MVEPGTQQVVLVENIHGYQLTAATGQVFILHILSRNPHKDELVVLQAVPERCPCGCGTQYWKVVEEEN